MTGLATLLSHLAVPLALSVALGPDIVPPALMLLALACAVLPDLDALGLWLGIPYDHPFGHRSGVAETGWPGLNAMSGSDPSGHGALRCDEK